MGPGLHPHRDPEAGSCRFPPSILIGAPTPPRSPRSRLEVRALPEPRRMGGRAACPLAPSRCRVTHRGLGHQQIKINEAVSLWLPPSGCCSVAPSLGFVPPPPRGSVLSPSSASKEPFFCIRLKNGDPPPTFLRWGPGTGFIAAPGTILKSTCQQSWGQGPWRDFLVTGQGPLRKEGVSSHPPAPRLLAGLTCQDRCDRRLCGQRLFCQRRGHHRQWRRQTHTLRFPNLAGDMVGKGEKHPNLYE